MKTYNAYKDPIIELIIKKLNEVGPTKLRGRYINGDVLKPNKSEMPMAYVARDTTRAQSANNMEDEDLQNFVITVILDHTTDINIAYNMVAGTPELYDFMEGKDPTTMYLKKNTLLYFARSNQQLANKVWVALGTPVIINYGLGIERRGPGIFSIEATMQFTVRQHQPTPGIPIV